KIRMCLNRRSRTSIVARAAITASFTTSVVSRNCSAERNCTSGIVVALTLDLLDLSGPGKLRANGRHSPSSYRICNHPEIPLPQAGYRQLSRAESADVPEIPGKAGADARRERPGEVRRVRAVRRGVPGRRDLPRGGGERRHGAGGAALRVGLSDPQDALHLLRVLRRSLPRERHLHGQGLRARRLQQRRFHLGQTRPSGPGVYDAGTDDDVGRKDRKGRKGRTRPSGLSRPSRPSRPCRLALSATSTAHSTRSTTSWSGTPTCRCGSRSATSQATTVSTSRPARLSIGSKATTKTSTS